MSAWAIACLALLPPLALIAIKCAQGPVGRRLAAVQLAGATAVQLFVCTTFAFDQASSIDLALTLALLTLPATLLFSAFLERWL